MKKIVCSFTYNDKLWTQICSEMDQTGKISIGDDNDSYVQVLPQKQHGFMPGAEVVIEMLISFASQVAIGIFTNWLYDKMKGNDISTIEINRKKHNISDSKSLTDAIHEENEKD